MALSNMTIVSDGYLEFVSISFNYLDRSEINVYFDSIPNSTWAWVGDTNQIKFTPKVPNGVTVLIARMTDASDLRHVFSEGAAFTAKTLDEDLRQVLHIVQEARETNLSGNFYDDIDMNNNKVTNLAPGSNPSDAVTFQQLQDLSPDTGLREELAKDYLNTGSGLVGFRQGGTGAVGRSVESKLRETVSVEDFYNAAEAHASAMIQRAIDAVYAAGGGVVELTGASYSLGASALTEIFDNNGSPVAASDGCIVMRPGVYLKGRGVGATRLLPNSPTLTALLVVSPTSGGISDLSIDGGWTASGAGHGIFGVNIAAGTDQYFKNYALQNLRIENVGSYGIGIQNGDIENLNIESITIYNTGADGIDIKNRGPAQDSKAIQLKDIVVTKFGQRLDGQAGVDVRGIANLEGIQVFGAGRSGVSQSGIRFRTASAPSPNQGWAAKSSITNFYVRGLSGSTVGVIGLNCGSSDVAMSNGTIDDCFNGIVIGGNVSASVYRASVSQVVVTGSLGTAFRETVGTMHVRYGLCVAANSDIGFRVEGTSTKHLGCSSVNCTTPLSVAGVALPTHLQSGCDFGGDFVTTEFVTAGRVSVSAAGESTDIDIFIGGKGAGAVRLGAAYVGVSDSPTTGYVAIKDSAGNTRKLAVIS